MSEESNRSVDLEGWNELIAAAKMEYSRNAGRDFGVAGTVRKLLGRKRELKRGVLYRFDGFDVRLAGLREVSYRNAVAGYLFWAEGTDSHGKTPCEGELKRSIASEIGMPPESVSISSVRVRHYLKKNGLPETWLPELMARVNHE